MTDCLYSFRVIGRDPGAEEPSIDDFVLAGPALECAHRLAGLGWIDVRCEEVHCREPGTVDEVQFVARVLYPLPLPAGSSPMSDSDLAPLAAIGLTEDMGRARIPISEARFGSKKP